MKGITYIAALCSLVFGIINPIQSSQYQTIRLHVSADPESEYWMHNICITTTGFMYNQACGNNAVLNLKSGEKKLRIKSPKFAGSIQYDDSCEQLYSGNMITPSNPGVLDISTKLRLIVSNHVKFFSITNCRTLWTGSY